VLVTALTILSLILLLALVSPTIFMVLLFLVVHVVTNEPYNMIAGGFAIITLTYSLAKIVNFYVRRDEWEEDEY